MKVVQVEVSTKCQLRCIMCPHTIFSRDWVNADMDLEIFKKIPFNKFDFAHLQGWGEPLLNPNIGEMIEIAKKHCKVGLTTNGLLIDEFKEIENLDYLAVSIASADEEKHKKIRRCSLDELKENIKAVSSKVPVTLVFMMLKDTYLELPQIVEMAKELGAKEVIANNLDYIPSKELESQAIFLQSVDEKPISDAKVKAEKLGVKLTVKLTRMEEVLVCAENPINNCLITYNGQITPCVYLHLPTKSNRIVRVFKGEVLEIEKVYFGDVREKKSWKSYSKFGEIFKRRASLMWSLLPTEIPNLPLQCKTCYKAYGV
ncbi:radical SAM/SPASM domain-containing protein [Archaeoglobus sp.]